MQEKICIHCFVSGKVQGVWFRASTQEQAKQLGLTGWARNLPDGRVEVLACGDKDKVAQLHTWLQRGPKLAVVSQVTYEESPWCDMANFAVQ